MIKKRFVSNSSILKEFNTVQFYEHLSAVENFQQPFVLDLICKWAKRSSVSDSEGDSFVSLTEDVIQQSSISEQLKSEILQLAKVIDCLRDSYADECITQSTIIAIMPFMKTMCSLEKQEVCNALHVMLKVVSDKHYRMSSEVRRVLQEDESVYRSPMLEYALQSNDVSLLNSYKTRVFESGEGVIIDNTFTSLSEVLKYLEKYDKNGDVFISQNNGRITISKEYFVVKLAGGSNFILDAPCNVTSWSADTLRVASDGVALIGKPSDYCFSTIIINDEKLSIADSTIRDNVMSSVTVYDCSLDDAILENTERSKSLKPRSLQCF